MFAGEEQDFLVVFEFIDVAEVLSINPNARGFVGFGFADELDFAEDLVLGKGGDAKDRDAEREIEKGFVECRERSHGQLPVRQNSGIAWERSAVGGQGCESYSNRKYATLEIIRIR